MLGSFIPEEYRKRLKNKFYPLSLKNENLAKTDKKISSSAPQSFASALNDKGVDNFNRDIEQFLKTLESKEKSLIASPCSKTIREYREAIGNFLKKASKNYNAFPFYKNRRHNIVIKTWQVLDTKLEKIYKDVIGKQINGVMLLDQLQSVKGLIIDLKIGEQRK